MKQIIADAKGGSSSGNEAGSDSDPHELEAKFMKHTKEKETMMDVIRYQRLIRWMLEKEDFSQDDLEALMADIDDNFANSKKLTKEKEATMDVSRYHRLIGWMLENNNMEALRSFQAEALTVAIDDDIAKLMKHTKEKETTTDGRRYQRLIGWMLENNNEEALSSFLREDLKALTAEIDDDFASSKKRTEEIETTMGVSRYQRLIKWMLENNYVKGLRYLINEDPGALAAENDDFFGKLMKRKIEKDTVMDVRRYQRLIEWMLENNYVQALKSLLNEELKALTTETDDFFASSKKHTEEKETTMDVNCYQRLIGWMLENNNVAALRSFLAEALAVEIDEDIVYTDDLKERTKKKESMVDVSSYKRLIASMLQNNLEAQRDFLMNKNPEALTVEIDDFGNNIFFFIVQKPDNEATIELLKSLVSRVSEQTLMMQNVNGLTAIHVAACAGNEEALQVFAKKNRSLLSIKDENEWLPIHHAAFWCRKETVQYLLQETDVQADFALLLGLLIDSHLNDQALELLKKIPDLATPDENPSWGSTVTSLAGKPLAFESGAKLGHWKRLIYHYIPVDQDRVALPPLDNDIEMQNSISTNPSKEIRRQIAATIGALGQKLYTLLWNILIQLVPCIKRIHDQKHKHSQTLELVRMMISKVTWTYNKALDNLKDPVLTAARLGIHEFVNEVLKAYPNSVLFYDNEGRNMFLLAVLHRKENVFSLIHDQLASIRDHTNYIRDKSRQNNVLHLAGNMLVPSKRVPGAALQMQRELQWFTGIRDLFQPSLQEQQNEDGLTPTELFTKTHKELVEKGERWMRDTATSCSVVGALIITIVFAAAFTVPGGFDSNGEPNFLNNTYFSIFAVSVAVALFSSTTSVQMFLGMLTSRYAEDDFLKALPTKLIIGLVTLFLSSISMMVAFGAAFCILLSHPWKWAIILICLLGCVPVTLFAWMQFPLLVDIFISTYGPGILNPKKYV